MIDARCPRHLSRALALVALLTAAACGGSRRAPSDARAATSSAAASSSASAAADLPTVDGYCAWYVASVAATMPPAAPGSEAERVGKDVLEGFGKSCVRDETEARTKDPTVWRACASCRMESTKLDGMERRCLGACDPHSLEVKENPSKAERADDFHRNVCDALVTSKLVEQDPAERLSKALDWSWNHVMTAPSRRTVGAVMKPGVAATWRAALLRMGAREAGYDGPCALADEYAKVFPCPPGTKGRCGMDDL